MNKRVLWTMIVLLWVFLLSFAVIKLFFGEWFLIVVENEKILHVGNCIDQSRWLTLLAEALLGFLVTYFYLCSCKAIWRLRWIECFLVVVYSFVMAYFYPLFPTITSTVDGICLILVPILMKVNWKRVVVIFVANDLGQALSLFIRSQPLYLEGANYATSIILVADAYVWILLYYLYANMYKEVKVNGNSGTQTVR